MTKRRLASYGLNLVGVEMLYALITLAFTFNAFGKSTTYIQGICTTACYTIIMVTSLNLVVGFMGEFSMGHAGFVSVGAYVSAIVSGALAGHGLSDLALLLVAILAGGLAFGNVDAVLYGIITSFAATMVIDNLLYGAGSSKLAIIVTNRGMETAKAISDEVDRGATLLKATGAYTGKQRDLLLCACGKNEIYKVRTAARRMVTALSARPDLVKLVFIDVVEFQGEPE